MKTPILTLLLCGAFFCANAQSDSTKLTGIVSKLEKLSSTNPVEKVYLHLNKPGYAAGDTIWFKAYVTIGPHHQPSGLSGIIHADLIDNNGSVVQSVRLQNNNGTALGDIALSDQATPGTYRIRAYTNWMRNAGADYIFTKDIYISGAGDTQSAASNTGAGSKTAAAATSQSTANAKNIDVQFFPEGGQLVNGVRSKVAFKAINSAGLGENVSGSIVDNDNNEVALFTAGHAGMGVFALLPQAGKTYSAKITSGYATAIKLPTAVDKGFVLSVNSTDSLNITVRIATNAAVLQEKPNSAFYLVAQSAGKVYYTTLGKLSQPVTAAIIPKDRFPSGIVQFTLFDSNNQPVNERLAFVVNPADLLNINLKTDKTTYNAKEKVNITLTAKDGAGKPAEGSFSVSVYHDDDGTDESSILSNILLTSDLKGYIENPNYYFTNQSDETRANLDALMLTQGYRRFEWKQLLTDQYPDINYMPEKNINISGILTVKNKPLAHGKVDVVSLADKLSATATADDQGRFKLDSLSFTNNAPITLQAHRPDGDRDVTIKLDRQPTDLPASKGGAANVGAALTADIVAGAPHVNAPKQQQLKTKAADVNSKLLNEIIIKGRKNAGTENSPWAGKASSHSANLNGPGHADYVFDAKMLADCFDAINCILDKVSGISKVQISDPPFYQYYYNRHQSLGAVPIAFMVDGTIVPLEQAGVINKVDVISVEVLLNNGFLAVYGSQASGGLVIITTKNGSEGNEYMLGDKPALGILNTKFNGFYKARSFYTPKYTPSNTSQVDARDAIYWNPAVLTGAAASQQTLEFYNSDLKGTYRVVVEGIDNDGNIGRSVYSYKIE